MSRDLIQIFLGKKNCSGRGVRFRMLTPAESDLVLQRAAMTTASSDNKAADRLAFALSVTKEGIKAMLVAVTRKAGLSGDNALQDPTVEWEPLDPGKLEMPGPYHYDNIFNTVDATVLARAYNRYHSVTDEEADDILGKAVSVSVD